jgi:hypothetical protein
MAEYNAIVPVVDHDHKARSGSRMRAVTAAFGLAMLATVALLATTGMLCVLLRPCLMALS